MHEAVTAVIVKLIMKVLLNVFLIELKEKGGLHEKDADRPFCLMLT